jgi:hypothetical protein
LEFFPQNLTKLVEFTQGNKFLNCFGKNDKKLWKKDTSYKYDASSRCVVVVGQEKWSG